MNVYGLKNCDSCRSALKWLSERGIEHRFHDVRKDGLDEDAVHQWLAAVGPATLINRRGTTWRGLSEQDKLVSTDDGVVALVLAHPALIKRPVFVVGEAVIVGFAKDQRTALEDLIAASGS